jgi:hypothetical protein
MKVQIVRDANGKVVASAEVGKETEVSVSPVLEKGHTVEEISAADKYAHDLAGFYKQNEARKK